MISTHTLTWSVTLMIYYKKNRAGDFNSHAHVERDYFRQWYAYTECNFNSHAHVERDRVADDCSFPAVNFNSHAHVERDQLCAFATNGVGAFQLTRSRGA